MPWRAFIRSSAKTTSPRAPTAPRRPPGPPETPAEIALARKLVKFADAVRLATDTLRPHFLCLYLYELAGEFGSFYTADKVLVDDPAIRARRLLLCARTLLTLETGLAAARPAHAHPDVTKTGLPPGIRSLILIPFSP
jgi:hypothetical protein